MGLQRPCHLKPTARDKNPYMKYVHCVSGRGGARLCCVVEGAIEDKMTRSTGHEGCCETLPNLFSTPRALRSP